MLPFGGCLYEPKFDGYRGMLFLTEDGCRVQSRRRVSFMGTSSLASRY
jgi:ATP-dependent DNA ligase